MKKVYDILMLTATHSSLVRIRSIIPNNSKLDLLNFEESIVSSLYEPKHIYVISKEDIINTNDYFITNTNRGDVIYKCDGGAGLEEYWKDEFVTGSPIDGTIRMSIDPHKCFKIIASTNKELTPNSWLSNDFVKKYIQEHNDGFRLTKIGLQMAYPKEPVFTDEDTHLKSILYDQWLIHKNILYPETDVDGSVLVYADMITTKSYTRDEMIHALTYGHGEGKKGIAHSETLKEYREKHL